MSAQLTAAQLATFGATMRRRAAADARRLDQRRDAAWSVARQAADLLRERRRLPRRCHGSEPSRVLRGPRALPRLSACSPQCYAYVLDPRRIGELMDVLPGTFAAARSQLADFADALEAIARS